MHFFAAFRGTPLPGRYLQENINKGLLTTRNKHVYCEVFPKEFICCFLICCSFEFADLLKLRSHALQLYNFSFQDQSILKGSPYLVGHKSATDLTARLCMQS